MTWTFCPKCCAKVEWAPTCSKCGAEIPLHDFRNRQQSSVESPGRAEADPDEQAPQGWQHEAIGRVAAFVACMGLAVAAFLVIRHAWLTPSKSPPIITAVSVSDITETSAIVTWLTNEPASSQVEYGLGMSFRSIVNGAVADTTSHHVIIESLEPGMTYYFRAKSTDGNGHSATLNGPSFNTPLAGANGQTVPGNVYFEGSTVVGADELPITLLNNTEAMDVSWEYLQTFLLGDQRDKRLYVDGAFVCADFAETLHNNAEKAGIRAAYVCVRFYDSEYGHALNAFNTTDRGLIYIDDTGMQITPDSSLDSSVNIEKGQLYHPQLIFPCEDLSSSDSPGIVSDFSVTW